MRPIFGRRRIVTAQAQADTFTRRAFLLGAAQIGVSGLLIGRMGWLAVAENQHYRELSESNRVQLRLIPPRRGWIVDRFGKPMAINRTDFRVDLLPDQLGDPGRVLAALRRMLGLSDDEMQRITEELARAGKVQPVPVAENVPYERFAAVSVRLPDLPGVSPSQGYSRLYPDGAAVAHLIGHVGSATAEDYARDHDRLLITPGFKMGKDGLEKVLEPVLRGHPGAKRAEVTARGKVVKELTTRSDAPGRTVRLTVDAGLQDYAARRLGDASGSAVVLDCLTGEILATVSMPAYDPNSFSDGISHAEWDMLSGNDHLPLMNKVFQGLYPPGSTVKPMNALSLLHAGIDPGERVVCNGAYRLGNSLFHCHKKSGHGALDMKHAIMQSCDVYFYTMVRRIGIDALAVTMRRLGLGVKYDLPVASQRYGTVPDTAWKLAKYKTHWAVADTINSAIGQGYVLANPMQLAVMAARLGSGTQIVPTLLHRADLPRPAGLGIEPEHFAVVRDAMSGVVNGGGTGGQGRLPLPGVLLAGKTGTAQVRRITMAERARGVLKNASLPFRLRDHSLFVCFAPFDAPRYACAVVIEHGGHEVLAAPIARDIMTYQFDKARALNILTALEAKWGGGIAERMARDAAEWRAARTVPPPAPPTSPGGTAPAAALPVPASPVEATPPPPAPPPNNAAAAPDEAEHVD